jgi:alanyl-tRNA synthetase
LIFDRTPFYGESGGQVGDTGRILGSGGKLEVQVANATKPVPGLVVHAGKVTSGQLKVGESLDLSVDGERRDAIRANHSATHLLHRALKVVLGDHVKQAGSVVASDALRFDYTHFAAPSREQLAEVEDLVNRWVRENTEAETQVMGLEEAKRSGAVALFGEKYGDSVRVVRVHPQSTELCGGTHVRRSGDIGLFKLTSESSIASGVRRITAVTGTGALLYFRQLETDLLQAADALRSSPRELVPRIDSAFKRIKELEKALEAANLKLATGGGGAAAGTEDTVREVKGVKVLTRSLDTADAKILRSLADSLRDKLQSGVVALAGSQDGKALLLVAATKDLVARGVHAGNLIREMAKEVGGSGGGKPDLAQAGGTDPSRIPAAMDKLLQLLGT